MCKKRKRDEIRLDCGGNGPASSHPFLYVKKNTETYPYVIKYKSGKMFVYSI
jgi:hypothetical protein